MPEQYVPYSKQAIGALQGNLATNGSLDEKAAENKRHSKYGGIYNR
jgi:hypothetical protein